MIFLACVDVVEVLEVVRQKGELELHAWNQQRRTPCSPREVDSRRTVCWQQNDMLATSML